MKTLNFCTSALLHKINDLSLEQSFLRACSKLLPVWHNPLSLSLWSQSRTVNRLCYSFDTRNEANILPHICTGLPIVCFTRHWTASDIFQLNLSQNCPPPLLPTSPPPHGLCRTFHGEIKCPACVCRQEVYSTMSLF